MFVPTIWSDCVRKQNWSGCVRKRNHEPAGVVPPTTLDELIEETACQIIFTLAPGATSDPLAAAKELLERYFDEAQQQLAEEERAQQNETLGILAETAERSDDPEQQGLYQQAMAELRQMQADEH